MYARRPMALSTRIPELLGWELSGVTIGKGGIIYKALLGGWGKGVVVRFDGVK